jgi:hypothetical protein
MEVNYHGKKFYSIGFRRKSRPEVTLNFMEAKFSKADDSSNL